MGIWPFRRRPSALEAEKLLAAVTRTSRDPALFGASGAPDTLEGRFEVLTLHAALALIRLQREPAAAVQAQEFANALFSQLDAGLREAGVGDLSVPKKINRLAGDFYGRVAAYAEALDAGDLAALEAALRRNIAGLAPTGARTLALHASALARAQSEREAAHLFELDAWALPAG